MTDHSLPLTIENPPVPKTDWSVGMGYRRFKVATILGSLWLGIVALHLISWGYIIAWAITSIFCLGALRLVTREVDPPPLFIPPQTYPFISLVVAAKNEAAVIANLIKNLCSLNYPTDLYEVWVIDDNSTDSTPEILDSLAQQYPQLQVLRRNDRDTGGKSGALNQVLAFIQGEIIGVFDADAQVSPDVLDRVLAYFQDEAVGAIQLRKEIVNNETNFLTRGQQAEMALDAYLQQQHIKSGGIGELRGNGQFIRRGALADCNGWNEETITDDLDLTIRLHLTGWDIKFMPYPPVGEEGVTTLKALWNQRNRWAEGGFQRYIDYWDMIASNRMGTKKTIDLISVLVIEYLLPPAGIFDSLMAFCLKHPPLLLPMMATLGVALPLRGIWVGLRRIYQQDIGGGENLPLGTAATLDGRSVNRLTLLILTTIGFLFFLHWLIIIPFVVARMALFPKRLKWVKTLRQADFSINANKDRVGR